MSSEYQLFSQNWSIYRKVVDLNYMHHQEFSRNTKSILESVTGSIRLMDLGCGDAVELSALLKNIAVEEYVGCDLSPFALNLAKQNLDFIPRTNLLASPLEEVVAVHKPGFDVIHSSFAIHHLSDEVKRQVLNNIHRLLRPGGLFILVDIFRKPSQSRQEYVERYVQMLNTEWMDLEGSEKTAIIEHLTQYDFPSDLEEFLRFTQESRFSVLSSSLSDEQHKMIVLKKPTD